MILAIDIGNTNIVLGCIEEDVDSAVTSRIATKRGDYAGDYEMKMRQAFSFAGIAADGFEGAIIASVVPEVTNAVKSAVKRVTGHDAIVVGAGLKTGMNVKIDDPGTLAADMLTGAIGAVSVYKPPLIIVDMGTATTIVAVDSDGAFIGGAIVPGVKLSYGALSSGTSLLPSISIDPPKKCISTNTVDCMKSGAVFGTAAMLDGMLKRMAAELSEPPTMIATGGLAGYIVPHCEQNIIYEPNLMLKGLKVLYDKNTKKNK